MAFLERLGVADELRKKAALAFTGEEAVQKTDGSPADWLAKAEARQPFGRLVHTKDVASLVAYLMGDQGVVLLVWPGQQRPVWLKPSVSGAPL